MALITMRIEITKDAVLAPNIAPLLLSEEEINSLSTLCRWSDIFKKGIVSFIISIHIFKRNYYCQ